MVINEDSSQYKHSYILELYNHQKQTKQQIQITLKKPNYCTIFQESNSLINAISFHLVLYFLSFDSHHIS